MHKFRWFALIFFIGLIAFFAHQSAAQAESVSPYKQIASYPEDIENLQMPAPADTGVRSHSALIAVDLANGKWQGEIAVDAAMESMTILTFAPEGSDWNLAITGNGAAVARESSPEVTSREMSSLGMGEVKYPATKYTVSDAQAGKLSVEITSSNRASGPQKGFIAYGNPESTTKLYTHLSTNQLVEGREVGLVTYLYEATDNSLVNDGAPAVLADGIVSAEAFITADNGREVAASMYDDGLHADGAANDGVFGIAWKQLPAGTYSARIIVNGETADGTPFTRTSQHVFPIVADSISMDTKASAAIKQVNDTMVNISLPVSVTGEESGYIVSGEIWGWNGSEMVPVTWLSGIKDVVATRNGKAHLPLTLDTRWMGLAGVDSRVEFRNLRIQDRNNFIPLVTMDTLTLNINAGHVSTTARSTASVTSDMLMGQRPDGVSTYSQTRNSGGVLMLVHGYCSGSVWNSSQFTNDVVFQDYSQNRTHDEFAQLIRDFGNNYSSFGVVAHSQGGAASTHLYTYYWSGLDYSSGNRLIQSVGTPYQGTSLAGNLAALGAIFGAGCGTNYDLTYNGAAAWLAGIPSWARSEVHYATTSFTDKWWRPDWCHIATDLFLDDPDDGTTEKWAGQLSGANNMGHKTGWCHTDGMRDPAQTTDSSRNANMNANANR